jgi:hypothetical protein
MIAELNKIAIVHLFLLGFEDELSNFTLGLTNPSTQADLLKIDVYKEKILLYKDLVSDPGNGIQAVSSTWAKKHIFGFSDEEIRVDLLQQRFEKAVGEELKSTATVITKTGLFDTIDKLYGNNASGGTSTAGAEPAGEETSAPPDLGAPPEGGDLGAPPPPPPGGEAPPPEGGGITPESRKNNLNILVEKRFIEGSVILDVETGIDSFNEMDIELDKLLNS